MEAKIIIPLKDNDGADNAAQIEMAIAHFCATFGGATVFDAEGCWVNAEGRLYREPVKVITAAAPERGPAEASLDELAKAVLDVTDQEAVFTSIDGNAKIINR